MACSSSSASSPITSLVQILARALLALDPFEVGPPEEGDRLQEDQDAEQHDQDLEQEVGVEAVRAEADGLHVPAEDARLHQHAVKIARGGDGLGVIRWRHMKNQA
jgi:hypothetical protein